MTELSQGLVLFLAAAFMVILVQHGWAGVKMKLAAIFLGRVPS